MTPTELPADNRLALRRVMRGCRKAALATLDQDGAPYASLVTVALDHDLAPILLLSRLADHTGNLLARPRCSLLFDGTDGHPNPQTGPRVTLMGEAAESSDPRLKARFLARHPAAAMYADFADFAIWRIEPARAHFVGGFARAVWFPAPFGLELQAVSAMTEAEPAILEHMNGHHADAVARMAAAAGGGEDEPCVWRMTAIDPDGCDLAGGERFVRVAFPRPVDGPAAARAALVELSRDR